MAAEKQRNNVAATCNAFSDFNCISRDKNNITTTTKTLRREGTKKIITNYEKKEKQSIVRTGSVIHVCVCVCFKQVVHFYLVKTGISISFRL